MLVRTGIATLLAVLVPLGEVWVQSCDGEVRPIGSGTVSQNALLLSGGEGIALYARMNINIDGYGRAYHRDNFEGGGVIHLCNGGEVFLPDGTSYQGSTDNKACARFLEDYKKIRAARFTDAKVGVIRWFGVLGTGSATIAGRTIRGVVPVEQADGSGFYVSPTTLVDSTITDQSDQRRYVNALRVPAAVVRNSPTLVKLGIVAGTLGVAVHRDIKVPVPFIVGDVGPRIGEGSVALARLVSGHPLLDTIDRRNRFVGQVDKPSVLWVFFGGATMPPPYEGARVREQAQDAFSKWGGDAKLTSCLSNTRVPVN